LYLKEPYDFNKQLADCMPMMPGQKAATTMLHPGAAIAKGKHILVTIIETSNPHESMLQPEFETAWVYLLSARP